LIGLQVTGVKKELLARIRMFDGKKKGEKGGISAVGKDEIGTESQGISDDEGGAAEDNMAAPSSCVLSAPYKRLELDDSDSEEGDGASKVWALPAPYVQLELEDSDQEA